MFLSRALLNIEEERLTGLRDRDHYMDHSGPATKAITSTVSSDVALAHHQQLSMSSTGSWRGLGEGCAKHDH